MKVVIVHYHLKRGGVTKVLESSVPLLSDLGHELVVLSSDLPSTDSPLYSYCQCVPELAYDNDFDIQGESGLARRLLESARMKLGSSPDIWHFHNHHLGKNFRLTKAVGDLGQMGEHLLLHIHDFPEDGRQINYSCLRFAASAVNKSLSEYLYPHGEASNIHYGVLNNRDYNILNQSGLTDQNLHLIPNPISNFESENGIQNEASHTRDMICKKGESQFLLYPSRCIRRKNIGEAILWGLISSQLDNPYHIGLTLKPENPKALDIYNNWVEWGEELALPVSFELGNSSRWSFRDLLNACDGFLTTSVAEGFGLAFLEPWLMNKGIVGRNLPDITSDFSSIGVDFGESLYDKIMVPLDWLAHKKIDFIGDFTRAVEQSYDAYSCDLSQDQLQAALEEMIVEGRVDFGRLSENHMNAILAALRSDTDMVLEIVPRELPSLPSSELIDSNKSVILDHYSAEKYVIGLGHIYKSIGEGNAGHGGVVSAEKVLSSFLHPGNFKFLCT